MRKLILTLMLVVLVCSVPLFSHCYEVGFKVMDGSGNNISIPIRVYERCGGLRIDNGNLESTTGSGYNFKIDLNDNCPPNPSDCPVSCNIISLDVGTDYDIVFEYSSGDKSLCFKRGQLQCTGGFFDTYYEVTPTSVSLDPISDSCEEELLYGYPNCQVYPQLLVSLVIYRTEYIGSKVVFYLRATASGGTQSYTFSWSGASRISPTNTTNPNEAKRTILSTQTTTVSVTVTSGCQSITKSKTLYGEIDP
jgi:hypothetical protein